MTPDPQPGRAGGDSISIVMPARDEEPRLQAAVTDVLEAARQQFARYELIIVDDGSVDRTAIIADRLASDLAGVRVIHLAKPHGLGGAFKAGLVYATMDYVTVAHGDGGTPSSQLEKIWARRAEADLIIPYIVNDAQRPLHRVLVSRAFRWTVNTLFRIRVRYHLHYVLYRRPLIQSVDLRTDSHAFQAEAVVKLLRRGCSFIEVGVEDDFVSQAPTRSYSLANIRRVALFFARTLYDVYGGGSAGRR